MCVVISKFRAQNSKSSHFLNNTKRRRSSAESKQVSKKARLETNEGAADNTISNDSSGQNVEDTMLPLDHLRTATRAQNLRAAQGRLPTTSGARTKSFCNSYIERGGGDQKNKIEK
jgi:hypothetical protein